MFCFIGLMDMVVGNISKILRQDVKIFIILPKVLLLIIYLILYKKNLFTIMYHEIWSGIVS